MSSEPPAKFFVNSGLVSGPADIYHLLRPLLRQTVVYRYLRGDRLVAHGAGWVERIVADRPDVSSFFTPISICLSVASWEHLEFETHPDQLISYALVQGDERVILRYVPSGEGGQEPAHQVQLRFAADPEYVQMELGTLQAADASPDPGFSGTPGSPDIAGTPDLEEDGPGTQGGPADR
ncbi:hypothetical protein BH23CHL8_BH23CHL8_25520 [soil metagenome]